ncbi:hypothetical protein L1856_25770 [Streptomyces sp. Tue 6430]|nr:hypothetical protein [Streptomyces sp. Tue 6430]
MRTFFMVATGFPTFLFTVPLLAAAGFWLLVAVGAAGPRTFDEDADLGALGLGGVPVAVAVSLWTALAWSGSLGAAVLLEPLASPGPARALTGLAVLAAAPRSRGARPGRCYGCRGACAPTNPGRPRRTSPGRVARPARSGRTAASAGATAPTRRTGHAAGPPEPRPRRQPRPHPVPARGGRPPGSTEAQGRFRIPARAPS